jgi:hypothetical protein
MSSEEIGPIDYILVEWPGPQPKGDAVPLLIDLVDRELIRIIDLAFVAKGEDGRVSRMELSDLSAAAPELAELEGAASDLLGEDDLDEAGAALEPGTSAALLVYENRWAAPFAAAVRSSGGELVAGGRIPVGSLLDALDAAEASERTP